MTEILTGLESAASARLLVTLADYSWSLLQVIAAGYSWFLFINLGYAWVLLITLAGYSLGYSCLLPQNTFNRTGYFQKQSVERQL
jgi:hypothetical protein